MDGTVLLALNVDEVITLTTLNQGFKGHHPDPPPAKPFPLPFVENFDGKIFACLLLTLKASRKTAYENVVCLCRLLNIFADFSNLFLRTGKQCGPRSDCSYRSSLIWVHTVCKNDF